MHPYPTEPSSASGLSQRRGWARRTAAAVPILLVVAVGAVAVWLGVPLCPAKQLAGIPCPGCGLTRATWALLSLDLSTAWRMHPLAPVLVPGVGWVMLRACLGAAGWCRGPGAFTRLPRAVWGLVAAAIVVVWVVRLMGGLGGHPDPVDPHSGVIGRLWAALS